MDKYDIIVLGGQSNTSGNGDNTHFCRESLHILSEMYYNESVKLRKN